MTGAAQVVIGLVGELALGLVLLEKRHRLDDAPLTAGHLMKTFSPYSIHSIRPQFQLAVRWPNPSQNTNPNPAPNSSSVKTNTHAHTNPMCLGL